jgi:hypothetical protein
VDTSSLIQSDSESHPQEPAASCAARLPAFVWILIALLLACQVGACIAGAPPSLNGKIDLRPFYSSGTIVRTGHASQLYVYDYQRQVQNAVVSQREGALPFLYPPFAALLFVPLSLLSYRHAFFTLLLLNLILLGATGRLLHPLLPVVRDRSRFILPTLYGCFFFVSVALMQGQISFLLLFILAGAWVLLHLQRPLLAGLLISCVLMKFQLALPMFALFIFWRQWRVVYGFLCGTLVLGLISFAIVGWAGLLSYRDSLIGIATQGAANAVVAKQRYGMFPADMPNLHGLFYGLSHGAHWGQALNIVFCCVAIAFAMCQRASLLVAVPAAMLVSYHMQPHDLTLLLLPLTVLLDDLLKRRASVGSSRLRTLDVSLMVAVLLLILPLAAVFMAKGLNYLVALAVVIIMVAVAKRAPSLAPNGAESDLPSKSEEQRSRPQSPHQQRCVPQP